MMTDTLRGINMSKKFWLLPPSNEKKKLFSIILIIRNIAIKYICFHSQIYKIDIGSEKREKGFYYKTCKTMFL